MVPADKWKWKHKDAKPRRPSKSCSPGEVYSHIHLPQETRKTTNKQHNLTLKGNRKIKEKKKTKLVERKKF